MRGWAVVRTVFPLTVTLSTPGVIFWPSAAAVPFTQTSPWAMSASAARREQSPESAMNFCKRIGSADMLDQIGSECLGGASPRTAKRSMGPAAGETGLPSTDGAGLMRQLYHVRTRRLRLFERPA